MKFYVVFGQRYHRERHPILGPIPHLPDRMFEFEVEDEERARRHVGEMFSTNWSGFFSEMDFDENERYYPLGTFTMDDVVELQDEEHFRDDEDFRYWEAITAMRGPRTCLECGAQLPIQSDEKDWEERGLCNRCYNSSAKLGLYGYLTIYGVVVGTLAGIMVILHMTGVV